MLSDTTLGEAVPLKAGQRGQIMEIYSPPGIPTGYHVEFFDDAGNTVALMIVTADDIRPLNQARSGSQH